MNLLKKSLILASLVIAGLTAQAQQDGPKAEGLTERMYQKVKFREELKPKVSEINAKFMEKAQAIRSGSLDRKEKAEALKAAETERTLALKAIFSPDEFSRYQDARKQKLDNMKARRTEKKAAEAQPE